MIPSVGSTCLFEFISKFETLNGVYRVRSETTFMDSISAGVDFFKNLYAPAGLTQVDYTADYGSYKKDRVVILESVVDNTVVYYAPESVFGKVPDPTIREYFPLVLAVDLGVQKNTQAILPLVEFVEDKIRDSLGTTNPVKIITDPNNRVYLTDAQYATLEAAREANKVALATLSAQLRASEEQRIILAAKVAAYEALIAQTGVTPP